jgi:hypothetical protein
MMLRVKASSESLVIPVSHHQTSIEEWVVPSNKIVVCCRPHTLSGLEMRHQIVSRCLYSTRVALRFDLGAAANNSMLVLELVRQELAFRKGCHTQAEGSFCQKMHRLRNALQGQT